MPYPPRLREAGPCEDKILSWLGFAAVYTPFNSIVIRGPWINDHRIIRHELTHYNQRTRHGAPVFWFLAFWYVARHGYEQSPFEIEARAAEAD